jgi:hypothetical protein
MVLQPSQQLAFLVWSKLLAKPSEDLIRSPLTKKHVRWAH